MHQDAFHLDSEHEAKLAVALPFGAFAIHNFSYCFFVNLPMVEIPVYE